MQEADLDNLQALYNRRNEIYLNSRSTGEQKAAINNAITFLTYRAVEHEESYHRNFYKGD